MPNSLSEVVEVPVKVGVEVAETIARGGARAAESIIKEFFGGSSQSTPTPTPPTNSNKR